MGKIVAIDYGKVRLGFAISDASCTIAFPLKTLLAAKSFQKTIDEVAAFIMTLNCQEVVLGLPLLLNGKDSDLTKEVRSFKDLLQTKLAIPIVLWDERLTSKQAEKLLIESQVKRKDRTKAVDTMSAALLLQSYLDSKHIA